MFGNRLNILGYILGTCYSFVSYLSQIFESQLKLLLFLCVVKNELFDDILHFINILVLMGVSLYLPRTLFRNDWLVLGLLRIFSVQILLERKD